MSQSRHFTHSIFKMTLFVLGVVLSLSAKPGKLFAATFAKGADVGWLSQMESQGRLFYDEAGTKKDCLQILQEHCINTIRLRVWVNPTGGWCGKADVINQAVRAKNMGFRILIDFHYSDSWVDPSQQTVPAAWAGYGLAQLTQAVSLHTNDVLSGLSAAGVSPEWVQVGNETNNGMLWETGRASTSMANFAALVDSGYGAVKAVFPSAKVIVHISNGYDNSLFRWIFDGLKTNGARWDVCGMSLYPDPTTWTTLDAQCLTNMNDMVSRYGKDVMIVEVGMDVTQPQASHDFLADILSKTQSVSGGHGLGVVFWEPEAYNWQGYTKVAFDNTGRPTTALSAFGLGCSSATPVATSTFSSTSTQSNTPTSTRTKTSTPTQTNTSTRTFTSTPSNTSTNTPSSTRTQTPTATLTSTRTATTTPINTPTPTLTMTDTATSTSTFTPTSTYTGTNSPTSTKTQTSSPTVTLTSTHTATTTPINTPTPTLTMTDTATSTSTFTPTSTYTGTNSPTSTKTQTSTPTVTLTSTRTATSTFTYTSSNTATGTPSATSTHSPTHTATTIPTHTSSPTTTPTQTQSPIYTVAVISTATWTWNNTSTSTPTTTPTLTPPNTITSTPSFTPTASVTLTVTSSYSATPTRFETNIPTATFTPTVTNTTTSTPTDQYTNTATFTPTNSTTASPTLTIVNTTTPTSTSQPTSTFSFTPTDTQTMDRAVTLSISSTPVLYPNPSSGETVNILTSFYTGSSNIKIQVFTAAFRLVRGMTMSTTADGPIILDLRDNRGIPLANGLYYVSVKTKNSQSLMKLFVLR